MFTAEFKRTRERTTENEVKRGKSKKKVWANQKQEDLIYHCNDNWKKNRNGKKTEVRSKE